jgi:hypothetical protein
MHLTCMQAYAVTLPPYTALRGNHELRTFRA